MIASAFIDTHFVISLINTRDWHHAQAVELADRYDGLPLLTTDAVLMEIGNGLAKRYKREAIRVIDHFLSSPEVEVVRLTPELFAAAVALYRTTDDKTCGLVDCLSFVVMRREGISDVLTFDRHFVQAGFHTLMTTEPHA